MASYKNINWGDVYRNYTTHRNEFRRTGKPESARNAKRVLEMVGELIESRQVNIQDIDIPTIARDCLGPNGNEYLRAVSNRKSGGFQPAELLEANTAVDTAAFANITGQLVFSAIREKFEAATADVSELVTEQKTNILQSEIYPGIGGLGDLAETIGEGDPYPTIGLNEEYVKRPPLVKKGFICPITREAMIADKTGLLAERAAQGAEFLGLNKNKQIYDVALGVTNNYVRNGTASNTYLTAGAYINDKTSNALVDWTDIENLHLLFDAIVDPNTNEPVNLQKDLTLVVPTALLWTAERIQAATGIRYGDGASSTTATYSPNPIRNKFTIHSTPYVRLRTSSTTKWFYGNFKKAVRWTEAWGVEQVQAPANSHEDFTRDIVAQYKVSMAGVAWMWEPRYVSRSDQ